MWRWVFLGVACVRLVGQMPEWTILERHLLESGDTLVRERHAGEWWIGAGAGTMGIGYLGRLNLPRIPDLPEGGLLQFREGLGAGAGVWVHGEWNPPGGRWGAALQLIPWESWQVGARFRPVGSLTGEEYELEVYGRSLTLSASARYTPGWGRGRVWEGLHLLAGVDARFFWSARERVRQVLRNTERVEEWRLLQEQPLPMWLGVHLGAGLDILVTLLGERYRNYVSPFVLLQTGLPLQRTWGSTWTPLSLRAGLSFKIGWERIVERLHPRIDTAAAPVLARVETRGGVPPVIGERLAPAPLVLGTEAAPAEQAQPEGLAPRATPRVAIIPNRVQRFSYPTSTAVELTPELQRYLDALVEYLRTNPQAEVRIIGHTDEFGGSLEETQRISEQRAQQVVEYLVRRGISRSRLLASGVGARQPIADNRTPEGRLQNRRVEIIAVQ